MEPRWGATKKLLTFERSFDTNVRMKTADKHTATKNDDTKERLLDAALDLFAVHGYAEVSVRQITARAGTHLSAVNYHFGDKRNLYLEVFRSRWLPRAQKSAGP